MKSFLALCITLCAMNALCGSTRGHMPVIYGSGKLASMQWDLNEQNLTGIRMQSTGSLTIVKGAENVLLIKGDHNIIKKVLVTVHKGILCVRREHYFSGAKLKYILKLDDDARARLQSIDTNLRRTVITPKLNVPNLTVSVIGSGKFFATEVCADQIDVYKEGEGDVYFGKIRAVRLNIVNRGPGALTVAGGYATRFHCIGKDSLTLTQSMLCKQLKYNLQGESALHGWATQCDGDVSDLAAAVYCHDAAQLDQQGLWFCTAEGIFYIRYNVNNKQ